MKTITFCLAENGDEMRNPTLSYIEDCFLHKQADFWCSGAGESYIDFEEEHISSRMSIWFHQHYGFYLRYRAWEQDFHSMGEGDFETILEVYVGGNPIRLPTAFFISKEQAFAIAKLFIENGTKSDTIKWMDNTNLDWDYGVI